MLNHWTHWGWVTHICVGKLTIIGSDNGLSLERCQAVAWTVPSHYLNQCWNIVNWTLGNKPQWNFNQNSNILIEENTFENVVCEMLFISSQSQCVNKRDTRSTTCWYFYHFPVSLPIAIPLCANFTYKSYSMSVKWVQQAHNQPSETQNFTILNTVLLIRHLKKHFTLNWDNIVQTWSLNP